MNHLKNALLVFGAVVVGLVILELGIFPSYLRVMPTNQMPLNERFGQQLAQSSKAGAIARDYIMMTGDSYSVGLGDALAQATAGSREPYASAHVIAERLGRDVLTIGNGGWSSVSSALAPGLFAEQARMSWRYKVPPPSAIVYYFYEGNDLDDNINWARQGFNVDFAARLYPAAEIAALLEAQRRIDRGFLPELKRFAEANLPATLFMGGAIRELVSNPRRRRSGDGAARRAKDGTAVTMQRAVIGGEPRDLPDGLQGPALDLSETEWTNAIVTARLALKSMATAFPGVPIAIVYLPSPLSSYDIVSRDVSFQRRPPPGDEVARAPADRVAAHLDRLRREICEIARDLGYGFVDATPAIRAAGRRNVVHGPRDWRHYNLAGYRILGNLVADRLAEGLRQAPPVDCAPAPP